MTGKASGNKWLLIVISALALCWVTFYNGFPVIYLDSATYIKSGFELETPADRPITYGIFLWLSSFFGITLYLTVFIQNLIISWLVYEVVVRCFRSHVNNVYVAAMITVTCLTGLPWVSNQIFADPFTALIFLSSFLIISLKDDRNSKMHVLLYFLFFLSVSSHLSHVSVTLSFLAITFIILAIRGFLSSRKQILIRCSVMLVLTILSYVIMGSAVSKSSSIFFTGSLCENGILKKYLDDNCKNHDYRLCQYRNELTYSAVDFVWSPQGATSKLGGWNSVRDEYRAIDKAILSDPSYRKLLLKESVSSSLKQFTLNNIGEGILLTGRDSNVVTTIKYYFPQQYVRFENSRQNNVLRHIELEMFNRIYNVVLLISASITLIFLIIKLLRKEYNMLFILASFLITGLILNNVLAASLANAIHRFGVRVAWLIPLLAVLLVSEQIMKQKNRTGSDLP